MPAACVVQALLRSPLLDRSGPLSIMCGGVEVVSRLKG